MRSLRTIACAFGVFSAAPYSVAAVDCAAPKTPEQQIICKVPELLEVSRRLSSAYEDALRQAGAYRTDLECDQGIWEGSGLQCYRNVECIKQRYLDRISSLQ